MSAPFDIAVESIPIGTSETAVATVLGALQLEAVPSPAAPNAEILKRSGWTPVAALVRQGEALREDRTMIEALKDKDPSLPIIFLSKSARPRRETAIRRLGIHYFLTCPVDAEELRLVLDVLIRAASSAASFERFFTR